VYHLDISNIPALAVWLEGQLKKFLKISIIYYLVIFLNLLKQAWLECLTTISCKNERKIKCEFLNVSRPFRAEMGWDIDLRSHIIFSPLNLLKYFTF